MTNEELTVLGDLAKELLNLRRINESQTKEWRKTADELREEHINCVANEARAATACDACESVNRLKEERDTLAEERDSARRKLGALARVISYLAVDVSKIRSPRAFLRDLKAAAQKCINSNDIYFTIDGGAK